MSVINNRKPQVVTTTHKKCSSCNELKLFSNFYKDSRNKNGNFLTHSCQDCLNTKQKSRYKHSDSPNMNQVITETHKSCSTCKELKPFSNFHNDKTNVKGKYLCYACKDCANLRSRDFHKKQSQGVEYKIAKKDAHIKFTYGISLNEYLKKLSDQNFKCAICNTFLKGVGTHTHLDHDHSTGKIRDFLCGNCNRGLGSFKDNKEFLMEAIQYLESHTDNGNQKEGNCP